MRGGGRPQGQGRHVKRLHESCPEAEVLRQGEERRTGEATGRSLEQVGLSAAGVELLGDYVISTGQMAVAVPADVHAPVQALLIKSAHLLRA